MSNLLEAKNLSKFYKEGNEEIKAVNNINFSIKENEKVVIYGRSGSGKSTLLNLLSGLDVILMVKFHIKIISTIISTNV